MFYFDGIIIFEALTVYIYFNLNFKVSRQVDSVIEVATVHCKNEQSLSDLKSNARNVTDTVLQLLSSVKGSSEQMITISTQHTQQLALQDASIAKISAATDNLFDSIGNAQEMIHHAKILATATTELVNSLKLEAHRQSSTDQQRKLLLAAKLLAEATARMVEAAKGCASSPQDPMLQEGLQRAAEDLKSATQVAAGDNMQLRLVKRLELCAKQAASCATQSIAAIQVCTLQNGCAGGEMAGDGTGPGVTQGQLIQQCKAVADNVPKIVQGIRGWLVFIFTIFK